MADQQDNLNSVNILSVGLNQDSSPLSLELGEYCYALNAGFDNLSGTANQINNYPSNELCITLKDNYILIGSCKVNTGHVIFSCDVSGNSEIGLLENCTYKVLINDPCLGFRIDKQIQCTYKETFNCGRRIYWTDNNQPRRFVDIDHIPYINPTLKTVDCDALLIQPNIDYPCVYYYDIQETGALHSGMYKPFIQYADVSGIGYTEWFESIGNVPIFSDAIHNNFNAIQGDPANTNTTKSILFYLSNLDTSYTHINIGILATHNGVLTASKVATIPTTSTEYLFTGLGDFIDLTLDELLIEKVYYKTAKTVTQSNGYLLWGNLSGRKDPNFQHIANNIRINWQVYKVPAYYTWEDSKEPRTTTFKRGYMRDEVYAFGIRLVYKDGSKSCVYHIPGRELNKYPTGAGITVVNGITVDQYGTIFDIGGQLDTSNGGWDDASVQAASTNFDNYDNNSPIERWRVYNTGRWSTGTYADGYEDGAYKGQCAEYGTMSYWESSLKYPETRDEDGNLIYPNDGSGNMDYIRHHKFPDASIIPLFDDASVNNIYGEPKLNYLGINVDNVLIPSSVEYNDVIGWEVVVGNREGNKSIIAKGLLFNTWEAVTATGDNMAFPTNMFNDTTTYQFTGEVAPVGLKQNLFTYYSPDTTFRKANLLTHEIKQEREVFGTGSRVNQQTDYNPDGGVFGTAQWVGTYNYSENPVFENIRRSLESVSYADGNKYNAFTNFDLPLYNVHRVSSVYLQSGENFDLTNNTDNSHPYDGAGALRNGVTIASFYSSLKLAQVSQYGQLDNITYLSTGTCPITNTYIHCLFGGDTYLSNFTFFKTYDGTFYDVLDSNSEFETVGENCKDTLTDIEFPPDAGIVNCWVESSINTELRNQGEDTNQIFYNPFSPSSPSVSFQDWFTAVGCSGDNYYGYLMDYSQLNLGKNICSQPLIDRLDCDAHYKTRCIYTLRSQQESIQDYWLVERPNDFYDFPKKSGALWDMRELGQDKVLFRFENGIYAYPAYDTLETDANTIQLGTGGIFAQEPKELVTTDTGYGGTRNQWAFNSTEFGHFFVDDKRGNVFRLQSTIEPISNIKMYNFFSKNLTLKLLEYFPDFANFDNPSNPEGVGFTSVFDDRFKIWLLTKKDYSPILGTNKLPLVSYNNGKFYKVGGRLQEVPLQDENYFCNKSFTIGFDAKTNRWVSFYSFIADSYLSDSLSFFSVKNNGVWKHHSDKYCQYYAEDFNHIIEYVVKFNGEITNKTSVQFITNVYEHFGDGSFYELQFETFKQAILYNNEACTGLLNLIVPDNNNLSTVFNLPQILPNSINVGLEKAGKCIWRNSYLWNHVANRTVNNPVFNSSCTPSIDKELNNNAINYNKSWYELARISQQWAKLRLIYPNTNYNIVTTLGVNKSIPDFM